MALNPYETFNNTLVPSIQEKNATINIGGVVSDILVAVSIESAKLKQFQNQEF